jgi:hypothetical protein
MSLHVDGSVKRSFAIVSMLLSYFTFFDCGEVLDSALPLAVRLRTVFPKVLAIKNIDDGNTRQLLRTMISRTWKAYCGVPTLQ